MQTISKYILTLVALLMTTTGAWATDIYVAGNGSSTSGNWCNGKNWEVDAAVNKMTEENGVYSITFTDVPAGDGYEFKFAENGSWDVNYGYASTLAISLNASNYLGNNTNDGPNITFSLSKTSDVTISFNLTEKMFMISTNGNKVGDDLLNVTPSSEANTWEFNMVDCSVEVTYVLFPDATLKSIDYIDQANAGEDVKLIDASSDEGTIMYYVSTVPLAIAPSIDADGWTANVPNAKDYKKATTLDIYLYIMADEKHSNSYAYGSYTVNILSDKRELALLPTSKVGCIDVTIGAEAVTADADGKVSGITPGAEVKIKANTNYKFSKVEVKKSGKNYIWQNDGSLGEINWNSDYRFASANNATGEQRFIIPQDVWDRMKTEVFKATISGTNPSITVTTGWWSTNLISGVSQGSKFLADNGDGTFTLTINFAGSPILDVIDRQHLMFVGQGYTVEDMYFEDLEMFEPSDLNINETEASFTMPDFDTTVEFDIYGSYEITIAAGEYATFYCDEAVKVEGEDAELYTITNVSEKEAVLSDVIDVAPAKTPLLVYNKGAQAKTFVLLSTNKPNLTLTVAKEFKGTSEAKEMPANNATTDYYVCNGSAFIWVENAGTISANKCWLQINIGDQPAAARAYTRSITGGNDTTGMDSIKNIEQTNNSYYDLNGRIVLNPSKKGIYIKNGKKVIIK